MILYQQAQVLETCSGGAWRGRGQNPCSCNTRLVHTVTRQERQETLTRGSLPQRPRYYHPQKELRVHSCIPQPLQCCHLTHPSIFVLGDCVRISPSFGTTKLFSLPPQPFSRTIPVALTQQLYSYPGCTHTPCRFRGHQPIPAMKRQVFCFVVLFCCLATSPPSGLSVHDT